MRLQLLLLSALLACAAALAAACGDDDAGGEAKVTVETLFGAQGNELVVYDVETNAPTVLIPATQNTVNGQICAVPDTDGHFLMGEDTEQENGVRQGWGEFDAAGKLVAKYLEPISANEPDQIEPYGCVFDEEGRLFTSDIGDTNFDSTNGKLILFFPPDYETSCTLASDIRVAGQLALDDDGGILVTESVPPGKVLRFSAPFPEHSDECAIKPTRETFIEDQEMGTPMGIARAANGNWFVSSVYVPTTIREYTTEGVFVRTIVQGTDVGNPAGIAVDSQGTLYYADLGIEVADGGIGPASGKGTVRKVEFDAAGNPLAPVVIADGYDYPDAVAILEVEADAATPD